MKSVPALAVVGCALALTVAADPSRASACVATTCNAGALLPTQGQLPENAVEVLWRKSRHHRTAPGAATTDVTPHLYRVEGSVRSELEITTEEIGGLVHVKPRQAVPAGSTLVFEYDETCGYPSAPGLVSTTFQVGPAAAPPSDIGLLRAEINEGSVTVNSAMCGTGKPAVYADLSIALSDEAKPYADALRHQLVVDGVPVGSYGYYDGPYARPAPIGSSILGLGRDRLFVLCGKHADDERAGEVSEGVHRVQLQVLLPDDTMLATNAIDVELRCPDSLGVGAGSESGAAAGTASEADETASAEAASDETASDETASDETEIADGDGAAAPEAETTDGVSASALEGGMDDDGCSVSSRGRASSSLWLVPLGMICAAWRSRRRRARRPA